MIIVYIVCIIYISKTRKWTFVQTNPTNLDCLHVEVTGEGSGTLVLNNQKQMGNVTTMYTFLFWKKHPNQLKPYDLFPLIQKQR